MLSMKDMFYGSAEPIWILNHDKDEDEDEVEEKNESSFSESSRNHEPHVKEEERESSYSSQTRTQQYSAEANGPYHPYYPTYNSPYPYHTYPYYVAPLNYHDAPKREIEVVMKVPICCSECEDSIEGPLNAMRGVTFVKCDIGNEKVTVVTTTAAAADILLECRKVFRQSRMWNDDD